MARLIILGATGSLGRHVLGQALAAGHQLIVLARTPAKLTPEAGPLVTVHTGDLNALAPTGRGRKSQWAAKVSHA